MRILVAFVTSSVLAPLMFMGSVETPGVPDDALTDASCMAQVPQEELPTERKNLKRLVANCKKCHADVHAEWSVTQHAKSWTDPVFQAEIRELPDKGASCARCHAPRSLWHKDMGEIPVGRKSDRDLGVNCVTCHMLGNVYFGPFDSQGHGGVEAEQAAFRESKMCFSCHGQPEARKEHDQMTSYLAGTAWTKDGKSCQSCHMSLVERKLVTEKSLKMKFLIGVQPVRMHDFRGARRGDIVAGCADVAVAFDGDKVVASVTTKTGHQLPCTTHREVVLKVTQYGADGSELASSVTSYSFPDGPSLPPGGPTTVEVRAAPGARKARATLIQILEKTEGRPDRIIQEINDAETTR
ncbi:MAG: hypothetical protein CMJ83_05580 [Planctomycetes bacterium]|nr:hypothetical protein [Planctomycetota bacterium]